MISIQQLLVVLGMSAASWVTYINSGAQWRYVQLATGPCSKDD